MSDDTIDDTLMSLEHLNELASGFVPDEDFGVIRSRHDVLGVWSVEIDSLDSRRAEVTLEHSFVRLECWQDLWGRVEVLILVRCSAGCGGVRSVNIHIHCFLDTGAR